METKHTPGPWKATKLVNNFINIEHSQRNVKGAITLALCRVQARQTWKNEAEANARLIAAAPDLLEALQEAKHMFAGEYPGHPTTERIFAAIEKATGAPA